MTIVKEKKIKEKSNRDLVEPATMISQIPVGIGCADVQVQDVGCRYNFWKV
jgi:hypothetical protein